MRSQFLRSQTIGDVLSLFSLTKLSKNFILVSKLTNRSRPSSNGLVLISAIARTVEKGVGRYGQSRSIIFIGLGCEAKYAKEFVYTEKLDISDKKKEIPIGVSCRTCDRLDCSQRAFPPLHKKFDIDINTRGVSVYVSDNNS